MKKNYDYVMQTTTNDCGIACIMSILLYYGINPNREEVLQKTNRKRDGTTAFDLLNVAKDYGLDAVGVKENITNIKKTPVIAHTVKDQNMFHFIVIYEIDKIKKKLKVMDPDIGLIDMSFEKFNEISTNVFLLFDGKKKKTINQRFKKELKKIFYFNKSYIIKTLITSVLTIILSLSFNYYLKTMLLNYSSLSSYLCVFIFYFIIMTLKNFITYIKNKLMIVLNSNVDKNLASKLSNHIFLLPYKYFQNKTTGELVTLIEDIENFKDIVTNIFIVSSVDLLMLFIIIFYLFFLNYLIALLILFLMIIILLMTYRYQYILNDNFVKLKKSKIKYNSLLIEYFTSFETVKNLNIGNKLSNILYYNHGKELKDEVRYNTKHNSFIFLNNYIVDFFYLLIILILCIYSFKNNFEILDIVLFSSIYYLVIGFLNNISQSICLYKVYETSVNRVLDCLHQETEQESKTTFNKINKIVFDNIGYKYNDKEVLSFINCSFSKNDRVYLTGSSGIGKSTLMKLLLKHYEISSGKILIDNIDIKHLDLSFIKNTITYIGQNETLYKGTIKDNLDLISYDKLEQDKVINVTLLNKFFEKNKIDKNYLIEENGSNLSGGERKKLILARGLLKNSEVLILDEVFNEISVSEERDILKNIFEMYKNKIIIVISHRRSNLDLFNKKLEIEGDDIYEFI